MPFDAGINFRSTAGFVTDGTNETHCTSADFYPTVRGSFTFGWVAGVGHVDNRDRNAGIDRRLAGINFDSATQTDYLRVDFPAAFSQTGTWVTGDFTFNDGTARTVQAVAQGAGIVDCTVAAGANNVCVAIDTTGHIFTIRPSADYTASGAAATVTSSMESKLGNVLSP